MESEVSSFSPKVGTVVDVEWMPGQFWRNGVIARLAGSNSTVRLPSGWHVYAKVNDLRAPSVLARYRRRWGDGYVPKDPDVVPIEAFTFNEGYSDEDVMAIRALEVGAEIELSPGEHWIQRTA